MKSGTAPDQMYYVEASAPAVGGGGHSTDRLLIELSQLIHRVSVDGISSPIDRVLMQGARQVLTSLIGMCDDVSGESDESTALSLVATDEHTMLRSVAEYGELAKAAMLEPAGPDQIDAVALTAQTSKTGKSTKRKAAKKKTTKKKAAKKKATKKKNTKKKVVKKKSAKKPKKKTKKGKPSKRKTAKKTAKKTARKRASK